MKILKKYLLIAGLMSVFSLNIRAEEAVELTEEQKWHSGASVLYEIGQAYFQGHRSLLRLEETNNLFGLGKVLFYIKQSLEGKEFESTSYSEAKTQTVTLDSILSTTDIQICNDLRKALEARNKLLAGKEKALRQQGHDVDVLFPVDQRDDFFTNPQKLKETEKVLKIIAAMESGDTQKVMDEIKAIYFEINAILNKAESLLNQLSDSK